MNIANIFDIKRFGINDGDGIRTVLFIKGCPLRCKWCQNPEGLSGSIRLFYSAPACVKCQSCAEACTENALSFDARGLAINHAACTLCGKCVIACPTAALRYDSRRMSVDEALAEIEKDRAFFLSGGGVTLSGGECTMTPEFSLSLLRECRKRGIDTAVETCLHAPADLIDAIAEASDMIIADVKLIDPDRHRAATGADNALILGNLKRLLESEHDVLVRVPLIPGFTDDDDNLSGIAGLIAKLNADTPVELINFNPMCREKYASMRIAYAFDATRRAFTQDEMRRFRGIFEKHGLKVH